MKQLTIGIVALLVLVFVGNGLNAQDVEGDILVVEYGGYTSNPTKHGIYIYWPHKDVEFVPVTYAFTTVDQIVAGRKIFYNKLNELANMDWELICSENNPQGAYLIQSVYFRKNAH